MQKNWIGKSVGVRFAFPYTQDGQEEKLWVFTTRADTIMGVTFCAVAPEHPLAAHAAATSPALAAFIEECKKGGTTEAELALREKVGMPTGLTVIHPLTQQAIPVWVGNYVLMSYGDGAVMGVPAHDERDFEFARKYGIAIVQVVHVDGETYDYERWQDWYADKQRGVTVNSDGINGLAYKDAVNKVAEILIAKGVGVVDPLNVGTAFIDLASRLIHDPRRILDAQAKLWAAHLKLWQNAGRRLMGETRIVTTCHPGDALAAHLHRQQIDVPQHHHQDLGDHPRKSQPRQRDRQFVD